MSFIKRFSDQHKEIILLCEQLKMITIDAIINDISNIKAIQDKLNKVLSGHLQLEDKALYPSLHEHSDPNIVKTSKRLQSEVLVCTQAHTIYQDKYSDLKSIQADPSTYVKETIHVIDAILERIEKEERELYSLLT